MTAPPAPQERTRRSFWFDPRFAIGIVLVLASIAGVLVVVASADSSTIVYASRDALSVGDRIGADDLVEQSVRLGAASGKYLSADTIPAEGLIVTRTVAPGELVPASAVGSIVGDRVASIVIAVSSGLPKAVEPGALVDVWASREGDGGSYGPPTVLVPSATVVRVIEQDGIVARSASVSVEVLVPRVRTARILEAIANADALSLIPATLPANLTKG